MQIAPQDISSDPSGFVLWEALVAMTLVVGVYLSSGGAYQKLVLKMVQQEVRYTQLGKDFDAFELAELVRTQNSRVKPHGISNTVVKGAKHESSGVPNRIDPLRAITKPANKN